jgi:hypothetical protein
MARQRFSCLSILTDYCLKIGRPFYFTKHAISVCERSVSTCLIKKTTVFGKKS